MYSLLIAVFDSYRIFTSLQLFNETKFGSQPLSLSRLFVLYCQLWVLAYLWNYGIHLILTTAHYFVDCYNSILFFPFTIHDISFILISWISYFSTKYDSEVLMKFLIKKVFFFFFFYPFWTAMLSISITKHLTDQKSFYYISLQFLFVFCFIRQTISFYFSNCIILCMPFLFMAEKSNERKLNVFY